MRCLPASFRYTIPPFRATVAEVIRLGCMPSSTTPRLWLRIVPEYSSPTTAYDSVKLSNVLRSNVVFPVAVRR